MPPIELTRFVKNGGPLTKKLHLAPDGKVANESSDCRMQQGVMTRVRLGDWREFAALIEETPRDAAWALGALKAGLPDTMQLVVKDHPLAGRTGFAVRTGENFLYRPDCPALVLADFDTKGMPAEIWARIEELGGFEAALIKVCAGIAGTGRIHRQSTSANVVNRLTGETYQSHGQHIYIFVKDGTDARRFLYTLHNRCWLNGLGWYIVGKAGQLLERSIIDRAVCLPERLVFEAAPDLEPPLQQDHREATLHDGPPLDTVTACANLSAGEQAVLTRLKAEAARALGKESAAAKCGFVSEQVNKAIARGATHERALRMAEQWGKGTLRPDVVLDFDDPELGAVPVAAVLANPDRYEDETLADPIEGVPYGRNCAIVQCFADGIQVYSFAHGGAIYKLRHDYATIEAAILAGAASDATNILCRYISRADLDLVERKLLTKLAGNRCGAGQRTAEASLRDETARQKRERAEYHRNKNAAESTKARLAPPLPDAEAGPVMAAWDDVLCRVDVSEPPMRDAEGCPVEIKCRETAGLHELTARGSNGEEDEKSRLPAPKNFLLTKHDKFTLEIEIGDHMTFVQETEDGERYVAPPDKFLVHYLKYSRSKLPRVHAVLTMPLVLTDGTLLSCNGLNNKHRAVFRINPALLEFIPKPEECTEDKLSKAYKFLIDEWLVDVATDAEGKCVLIAFTLSIIERVLFPERPVFFVTAGQRGGGKTTALKMATLAALGVNPPAAAWTNDGEERKKALFAYLREGLPVLIWDNIPRGLAIGCPHIERACTSETYQDRVLGATESGTAPAYTIQAFTGNNILSKSDQASRSLETRLTADRPDPENRPFLHADPIGWTLDHRGEILRALYVILLGNPQLAPDCRREAQTRFKTWWRLVGSAVEHAATTVQQFVSFKDIFERVEGNDDEAAARGEILQTLLSKWPDGKEFTSRDLLVQLDNNARDAASPGGQPEPAEIAELRRFCTPKTAKAVSAKSIGNALTAIFDAPAAVPIGTIILHSRRDRDKVRHFFVGLEQGGVQ
jgi:hypothetical protein